MLLRLQWLVVTLLVVLWLAHAGTGLRPSAATDAAAFVEQQSHNWARRFTRDFALATGGGLLAALGIPDRHDRDMFCAHGQTLTGRGYFPRG